MELPIVEQIFWGFVPKAIDGITSSGIIKEKVDCDTYQLTTTYFFTKEQVSAISCRKACEIFFRSSRPTASCTAHKMDAWSRKHFKLHAKRTTGASISSRVSPSQEETHLPVSQVLVLNGCWNTDVESLLSLFLLFSGSMSRFQSL